MNTALYLYSLEMIDDSLTLVPGGTLDPLARLELMDADEFRELVVGMLTRAKA